MKLAVLTSGGDAPGMNAAVRTVTVGAVARGHSVVGIPRGYEGLLAGETVALDLHAVDGISRFGGTVLGSARSKEFPTLEGQAKARARLRELGIEGLVVIGGNGSLAGAHALAAERAQAAAAAAGAEGARVRSVAAAGGGDPEYPVVVGLPASIDNDVGHTALAIGADTACNTIVEACDRITDTARAHRRAFVIEVMGRHCGFLAMRAGIAAEADAILYGENKLSEEEIVSRLRAQLQRIFARPGNRCALIIKAEGVGVSASKLVARLAEHLPAGVDIRETVLGHLVRGGAPSALDRLIAQRLGYAAVDAIEHGQNDVMLGWDVQLGAGQATRDSAVRAVPLADVLEESQRLIDGSSPIVQRRMKLLAQVEDLLAL
jgi:6-phosphofructokinase 1